MRGRVDVRERRLDVIVCYGLLDKGFLKRSNLLRSLVLLADLCLQHILRQTGRKRLGIVTTYPVNVWNDMR